MIFVKKARDSADLSSMGLRLFLFLLLTFSFTVVKGQGATAEVAKPNGTNSGGIRNGATGTVGLSKVGVDPKTCSQVLSSWVDDDYENAFFGLLKSRAISCELFTQNASKFNTPSDLQRFYEDRFKNSMDDNSRNYLQGCSVESNPKGKQMVGKYFYAMDRFESASPQIIEQVAAIDNILPGHQTLQNFDCGNRFGVQKICDGLKRSCEGNGNTEEDFQKLVSKVKAAAEEVHELERVKNSCASNRQTLFSDNGDLQRYHYGDPTRVLESFGNLPILLKRYPGFAANVQDMKKYPTNATIRQTTYQNFGIICADQNIQSRINQLKSRYPFMDGEIFKGRVGKYVPSMYTKAEYSQALKEQLEANRSNLDKMYKNIQSAAHCLTSSPAAPVQALNMRTGTYYNRPNPANEACTPERLTAVVSETPLLNEFYTKDKAFNESMSMQISQACKVEGSQDRNKTDKILTDASVNALLTVGTAGVGIGVSGLTGFGKTLITARTAGAFTRFAPGFILGTDVAFASLATKDAINVCQEPLAKIQNNFRNFEGSKANQCPTGKNQVSQALESADDCVYAKTAAILSYTPVGLAGVGAVRGLIQEAKAVESAAPTIARVETRARDGANNAATAVERAKSPAVAPKSTPAATPSPNQRQEISAADLKKAQIAQQRASGTRASSGEMAAEMERVKRLALEQEAKKALEQIPTARVDAVVKEDLIRLADGTSFNLQNGRAAREIAKKEGRLIEGASVNNIENGKAYNFTITEDGKLTLGQVNNNAEVGVKHLLLADGRGVKAAGEIRRLADGTLEFNLRSGTYTVQQMMVHGAKETDIAAAVQAFLKAQSKGEAKFLDMTLTPVKTRISDQQIQGYCRTAAFKAVNDSACGAVLPKPNAVRDAAIEARQQRVEIPKADIERARQAASAPTSSAQSLPNMTGKTRAEAASALEDAGFTYKSTTASGYRQYKSTDGSVVWIRPNGEVTRSGPKIKSLEGKPYSPRYDQNGKKVTSEGHNTGEFLIAEPIQARSNLSQAELNSNAALPVGQKVDRLEALLKRPTGSLKNSNFEEELQRIEAKYPTEVSTKPVAQRTREEQKRLLDKRAELRKLGLKDDEIQKGMDAGYFGSADRYAGPAVRVEDPKLLQAILNKNLAPEQRYISFVDADGKRWGAVVEAPTANNSVRVFDGHRSRVLTSQELLSARVSSTSAKAFGGHKPFDELFPAGSPSVRRFDEGGIIDNSPKVGPPYQGVRVLQAIEDRSFAVAKGLIKENVPVTALEKGKSYTYIITSDGKIVYGEVENAFEYGVKHIQLANGRPVVAAGEIRVNPDGTLNFNLESGSFTKVLIKEQGVSEQALREKVKAVLQGRSDASLNYTVETLLPKHGPTRSQMRDLCGHQGLIAFQPACKSLETIPETYAPTRAAPVAVNYPAGAARNPAAMQASPAETRFGQNVFAPPPKARSARVQETIPPQAELSANASLQSEARISALEKALGGPILIKNSNGKFMSPSELAKSLDDIEARFPTTVSRKPFSERSVDDRVKLTGKIRELKKLGFSENEIRVCLRNGFCGDPPSGLTAVRILDSAAPPPLATPSPTQVQSILRKGEEEIRTFNFKRTEEAQLSEVGPAFTGQKGSAANAEQGFEGARNVGVEIINGPERPLFAKITEINPATAPDKTMTFKNEVFFTKLMSDVGKGPEFHGIFVRRSKPGQPAILGDGNYRIMTDAVPGQNFQLSQATAESARRFSYKDIDQFEREAKSLVNDYGINPGDYQARISRGPDGKPKVYVVDAASFSFHRGRPQTATNYLRVSFQEYKSQKIATDIADLLGPGAGQRQVSGIRIQLEKMPSEDFNKIYELFKNASPAERQRLSHLPLAQWP